MELFEKGVLYVKDFFNEDGNALSYNDFTLRFDISDFPFTKYFGIINSICSVMNSFGRRAIHNNDNGQTKQLELLAMFCNNHKVTKIVYPKLIDSIVCTPSAYIKWTRDYPTIALNWSKIFNICHFTVNEPKIRFFQFRFIHRILSTNGYLYKLGYIDSPKCSFCNDNA